jgi:hypothetical protein
MLTNLVMYTLVWFLPGVKATTTRLGTIAWGFLSDPVLQPREEGSFP